MSDKELPEGDAEVTGQLPDDQDPDVLDGMAKLELLRQMEHIEALRE